jgi:hypothetical protein
VEILEHIKRKERIDEALRRERARAAELQQGEPFPENSQIQAAITGEDRERAESRFVSWARKNAPFLIGIFDRDESNDSGG